MSNPEAARAFLIGEIEALEPFDCVVVATVGQMLQATEVTRREDGALEVRVPGRPTPLPALTAAEREALNARGFESSAPEDPVVSWTHEAESAEQAVDLLQEVRVTVFGAKPDAPIDIAHGSHRLEHEARKKLAVARERIESIVQDILGRPARRDPDGDYVLPIGNVHVMVAPRAGLDGGVVIRVFAITNVGINVTAELALFLARLNFGLMFGRFTLDVEHRSIWFDETLLGEQFREEELRFAVQVVASTADAWDDRLRQMFGGVTHQEVLSGKAAQAPPPSKPGEGVGLYL
ncbi:MAG: YbjN domain-containing protein, partial [Spirochaetaceae bacterium]|nr:YbjN domain-containing protein [Myxococcales bacterium]MCB9726207.1 YbjN domain-containing protein [Spirochaetaceae bacterium]